MNDFAKLKLYSTDFSPFSTRVRIALYHKQIPFELLSPPGGVGSVEFQQINPIGNIPVLVDNDRIISESSIILEYIEDRFPNPSLRSDDPWLLAQIRLQSRFTDLYLAPALYPLFEFLKQNKLDEPSIEVHIKNTHRALAQLETIILSQKLPQSRNLHLGDCALAPSFYYVVNIPPLYGVSNICEPYQAVSEWWEWVNRFPSVERGLYETGRGFQSFLSNLNRPLSEVN